MAKTDDGVSQACAKIEIQPGCTGSWYDVGGELTSITGTKVTRETGSTPVFNDQRHVIAGGKTPPITVTVSGVYSEVATEAFWLVKDLWETPGVSDCDKQLCIRWIPKGGTAGDAMYEMTDNPQLVGFQYPEMDAGAANPMTFEFDVFGYIDSDTFVS
jgi:hypothetical protein